MRVRDLYVAIGLPMTALILVVLVVGDGGVTVDAGRVTAAQAERDHLRAVQDLARARIAASMAQPGPAREKALARVDQLTRDVDLAPAKVAAARNAAADARAAAVAEEESARAERGAELAARTADPAWAAPLLSAVVCRAKDSRAEAKAVIAEEKKYARAGGGVVDIRSIYQRQQQMRDADQSERWARAGLRAFKRPAASCSAPLIADLSDCIASIPDEQDEQCWPLREYVWTYDAMIK